MYEDQQEFQREFEEECERKEAGKNKSEKIPEIREREKSKEPREHVETGVSFFELVVCMCCVLLVCDSFGGFLSMKCLGYIYREF